MQGVSRALALVAGLLLLVIVELGLRALGIGPSNDLFMAEGEDYRLNPQAARRFFSHQYARLAPGQDRFVQDEDEGVLSIFVIGASTLLDFPNPAQTSFPNFLQLMLEDAYPGREIEVINCGITAINSYVLLDFAEEVAAQEPDLVLIYAGHNEFVGPMVRRRPLCGWAVTDPLLNCKSACSVPASICSVRCYTMRGNGCAPMAKHLLSACTLCSGRSIGEMLHMLRPRLIIAIT